MTPDQENRCEAVLAETFHGLHHVRDIKKDGQFYWTVCVNPLATWDFDELTRLVLSAHRHAVRVQVGSGGPRKVQLTLHPRERDGGISQRHPTIENAIERYLMAYPETPTQPKETNAPKP